MISTNRLILRRWREDDRDAFFALNSDPQVMEHLGGPQPRERSDEGVNRQNALIDAGEPAFWAAERREDGAFMGFIGLKPINFAASFGPGHEIGWRLARRFWGQGYASEGARACLAYGFGDLGLAEVFAFTVPGNLRSQAVMTRIGMTRVEGGDFDHPELAAGHPLRRHVLYRIGKAH